MFLVIGKVDLSEKEVTLLLVIQIEAVLSSRVCSS